MTNMKEYSEYSGFTNKLEYLLQFSGENLDAVTFTAIQCLMHVFIALGLYTVLEAYFTYRRVKLQYRTYDSNKS